MSGAPAASSAWHRLDPLTRLTLSVASIAAVVILGGVAAPLLVGLVAVGLPASLAGVLGRVARLTLLVSLPLALGAAIVNVLFTPGGESVVLQVGPLRVTSEGVCDGRPGRHPRRRHGAGP